LGWSLEEAEQAEAAPPLQDVLHYVGTSMGKPTKRPTPAERKRGLARHASRSPSGLTRSRDLEALGTSRSSVRRLVKAGKLQHVTRGLYAPPGFVATEHHGLATAAALVPNGVVCLLSALQFHEMGTQAPFEVWLAIDRKARKPTIIDPPLRIVRFSPAALLEGIEEHQLEGVPVRITSAARTVADCFKYRNKLGLDVAMEALRAYRRARRPVDDLTRAARTVRVSNVMRPYLEAVLA
jgi:predicted transcriptional regulator of viral defense system